MPQYYVNLSPIGYNFRGFTRASDKGRAVRNLIVRYLEGGTETLGLFIWKQKEEYGDDGWIQKIDEMAIDTTEETAVPYQPEKPKEPEQPQPEQPDNQLNLFEFEKFVNKQHPATDIAHSWKMHNKMQFMEFDKLPEVLGGGEATFSAKMDGELCCLYFDGTEAELVTIRGTVRKDMPITKEAAQLLSKHKSAAFLGELYALDEQGKPQPYMKAVTVLRDPKGGNDESLRFSVFDIYSLDGTEYEALTIEAKMKKINEIFGNGKYVHPAPTTQGKIDKADELWSQLDERGWEGIVVHYGADLYKIKPIHSYDMVVIGINKSDKFMDQMSAVLCAFVDKEGRFRLSGAIGGGFNDEERIRMLQWAERNKVMEDDERIWVDPFKEPLVVEIEAIGTNEQSRPTYEFKGKTWVKVEDQMGGTLRFPQFVRQRDDKDATYEDVPVEQVVHGAEQLRPGKFIRTVNGSEGTIVALVPRLGSVGPTDFDVVIRWANPMQGDWELGPCHVTEIKDVWG